MSRRTLLDIRYENVIRQSLDFSCGAAALATLLTYYFDDATSESRILSSLATQLSSEEKAAREYSGYSLLDLKRVAESYGYRAAGFRLTLDQLERLVAPVLVYVEPDGFRHFAVLRGVVAGRVLLADPARGNLRMSLARFAREWGGVVFVVGGDDEESIGRYPLQFNSERDFRPAWKRFDRQLDGIPPEYLNIDDLRSIPVGGK